MNPSITDKNQVSKKKRAVVAMSGGVDSSVAAALMVEQGYDVIGLMMRLWSEDGKEMDNRCCTPEQMDDARQIAGNLGIPFHVVDVKDYFKNTIVDFYLKEHSRGRTPNPCIECNREIRFNWLYERAMSLNADFLVTGHYAQVKTAADNAVDQYQLHTGIDNHKDQSYVLHMLDQEHLAHVQFPVGGYTKPEVRELARKFNLPVASKGDSMDLCFLSGEDYRGFLARHVPEINRPGPIYASDGEQLGEHIGLPNYTIGQRKGLGVTSPKPLFVLRKDATDNALILGTRADVVADELMIRNVSWVAGSPPDAAGIPAEVKIRYKARPVPATIFPKSNNTAHIVFHDPVFGATPGQGAVFYQDTNCLGGGLISDFN
ncbi:MAG: tRNA-specific 2-thiouridylase [Cellvibrionaceae bacterium]|jgi:tRNA-specific 2-thiouridylase